MLLEVLSPEKKIFGGDCSAIVLPGIDGKLEIRDRHAPLIAALGEGEIKVSAAGAVQLIKIKNGFAEVLNNKVTILVENIQ